METRPFWARPIDTVFGELGSGPAGLGADEARARRARFGPNEPAPAQRFEPLREIGSYQINPLVLILLCTSAVSAIFVQVWGVGACVAIRAIIPFTPFSEWLGFTPLPPLFFAFSP